VPGLRPLARRAALCPLRPASRLGRKVSDEFTVPVCRLHHRELHRYGDETAWWAGINIDPLLWRQARPGQLPNGGLAPSGL
jgi:hypothetical protein